MEYVIYGVIAYLLGSIPFALVVGKIGYKIDVREHGSGNLGATNAFRVLGIKAGIIVTLADILKGTVATLIPLATLIFVDSVEVNRLIIGVFAVLGHTYPAFANFKGGKAVATSSGIILGVSPLLFLAIIVTFTLTLFLFKYVSLASMLTGIVASIIALFMSDTLLFSLILILTLFVIYRHIDNIKRIINKTEPKITWM